MRLIMVVVGRGVKVELFLRTSSVISFGLLTAMPALPTWADALLVPVVERAKSGANSAEFQLGGSVERRSRTQNAALAPNTLITPQQRTALSLPLNPANSTRSQTNFGDMVLFADEGSDDGRDAFRFGTSYTQGVATAGLSVTYVEEGSELSRSEVYVDFALNRNFSVGLAGILDNDFTNQDDPIPQLGLNAAYETEGGAFFEGAISEAESSVPQFGVAIGLRF